MKTRKRKNTIGSVLANLAGKSLLAAAAFALVGAVTAQAGLTGFVTIGDAGNDPDGTDGFGAVGYEYQISATEVSAADINATGAGDGDEGSGNTAAINVSLYEAMRYANYLTTTDVDSGYYTSNGDGTYEANALSHDAYAAENGLTYFVPTDDEWYKAAYYKGSDTYSDYADGTDISDGAPLDVATADGTGWNYDGDNTGDIGIWEVGGSKKEQNHDTYDMMGNVWEWMEPPTAGGDTYSRGGSASNGVETLDSTERLARTNPGNFEGAYLGFRVVAIPEPTSGALFVFVAGIVWFVRRKVRG